LKVYRLIENIKGRSPLGYGLGGGRWNFYGTPVIYCCSVSSLNFLELLSIKGPVVSNASWILVTLELITELSYIEIDELPPDWKTRPYPISTQQIGTAWAKQMISPVLKIPSCRIPVSRLENEFNILINPLHPEFHQVVKLISAEEVGFEVNY
jgi:RES domain-containing protein